MLVGERVVVKRGFNDSSEQAGPGFGEQNVLKFLENCDYLFPMKIRRRRLPS